MDQRLYKATIEGNVDSLSDLIQQDPLILDRITNTTSSLETPLHIAIMLGHEQFAIEILNRKPKLAAELDSRRSSPLHLASAKGNVGIVKALLIIDSDMCFACDRDGRNPLHVAAVRGRIEVLKEMLTAKPDAALAVVNRRGGGGESILHLCVEYCQFEALKVVMENVDFGERINSRDGNGNTVLHVAVADNQIETTEYLLSIPTIQVNTPNLNGMTSMDILFQRRREMNIDLHLQESLNRSGAKENNSPRLVHRNIANPRKNAWKKLLNHQDDWLDKKRSALMVVASLIATMAFQVGIAPPVHVWDDCNTVHDIPPRSRPTYYLKVMYNYLKGDARFYIINTTSFIASLSIILLLMSGLPLKNRVFMWMLMVITWIAITAIALTYSVAVLLLTPSTHEKSINVVIGFTVFIWICLMALLLFGHTVRLFVRMVKVFVKMVKLLVKCLTPRRRVSGSVIV
ncbi:hypothetical protein BUALT_Bualt01G0188900 [Buddleja alternifolia]|uniref:PGG domain-containing protein n=1 Tax=Buddleja alternifolia TaxID=168488 RepID=A0AAV6YIS2_9LAMI|nr:hypothetical protein BUALT_Bualt01G0188900 [Buddleja alternifolia]